MAVLIKNGNKVGGGQGGEVGYELTKAEYDELKAADKIKPDTNYYITDIGGGGGSGGEFDPTLYYTKAQIDLLLKSLSGEADNLNIAYVED